MQAKLQETKKFHLNMQAVVGLLLMAIFISSCQADDTYPKVENITKGEKWTLKIGSSPAEVFLRLQTLGEEKGFHAVGITRQAFSKPEEVENLLPFYNVITIEHSSGRVDRACIGFNQGKVKSIEKGGALLDSISHWPQDVAEEIAIRHNDSIDVCYQKLLEIYKNPNYANCEIIMPNKPLNLPFDPDMVNYGEWSFDFYEDMGNGKGKSTSVNLLFKKNALSIIRITEYIGEISY